MINSLQLIIHLPIMNVPVPANVMTLIRYLVPIVMFDILDQDFIWDYIPGSEVATEADIWSSEEGPEVNISDQIQDLGYEQHGMVDNLGTLALLTGMYFVKICIFYIVVKPYVRYTKRGKNFQRKMEK
jgi:hypothetical protein